MLFSGISFLYYFLPSVLIVYFLAPDSAKNAVLLLFSLLFYAWGEPRYVLLMAAVILMGYVFGLLLERFRGTAAQKPLLALSIVLCLSPLVFFKYMDFLIANINALTGGSLPLLKLVLPIGISFYTFQVISYLVDVCRGDAHAQKNIISLAAYVALFAQLIAGPIVRYTDVSNALEKRTHTFSCAAEGIRRFVVGLSKKLLLANVLGELVEVFKTSNEQSVGFFWLYALACTFQIYFDFSAYSDMAIGLGRIFGFSFPENFNYPYISGSITEFWRRWHMTLGSWFRDYVYIPLGGNRAGRLKWYRNIGIVWLLTGLWHGADWNFIIWGLLFAVLLIVEKSGLLGWLKKHPFFAHVYVLAVIVLSFVIFDADTLSGLGQTLAGMFGLADIPLWNAQTGYYFRSNLVVFLLAAVGSTPLPARCARALEKRWFQARSADVFRQSTWAVFETLVLAGLLLVCTAFLVDGSFNPFLYFRF